MITKDDLLKKYSTLTNEELLEIVDNKKGYTELAVTTALEELSARKITEDDIKKYKDEQTHKVINQIRKNIVDDLTLLQKHWFYFIWFPLVNIAFKQNFREDGYALKLKQANYYSFCGAIACTITALFYVTVHPTLLQALGIWLLGIIPTYTYDEFFNRQRVTKKLHGMFDKKKKAGGEPDMEKE